LRGRRTVRADRRSRTDDETVRTQSAILDKSCKNAFAFINNRVFGADTLFIHAKDTVRARSAQSALLV